MALVIPHGLAQPVTTALRTLPVVLVVLLSTPAWITWPFLSDQRQQRVIQVIRELAAWASHDPVRPANSQSAVAANTAIPEF
ncbi:hypothetical protein ACFWZ2_13165 [Streptomyces sp. NPDC059002]|uniref:hypothetical protein n=1 Tax=Streptomyces sp. NPDC059002 TaxID=3346690 RepID=UPI0036AB674E